MHPHALAEPTPAFSVPGHWAHDRLLLISYHFPPAQTAGALRWEKLARFAAERGLVLDVVCLAPSSLAFPDWSRAHDLPPGTRLFGVTPRPAAFEVVDKHIRRAARRLLFRGLRPAAPSSQPPRLDTMSVKEMGKSRQFTPRGALRAYNAWLAHHRDTGWARRAASIAIALTRVGVHRAVVSSGPPHSAHDAARRVAERTGLPFVMDLRDPWSLAARLSIYEASPLAPWLARRLERRAVEAASLIVTVTDESRDAMRELYTDVAHRIITVMNGYDEEPMPVVAKNDRFTIAYAGEIYIDRDPRPLFRAAARVVGQLGLSPDQFGIAFLGPREDFGGVELQVLASREGIAGYVEVHPARPRREALEFLARAAVLVSLPQDLHLQIPSKMFEYIRFDAWLLVLAERGSATERLLRDTGADVVAPTDIDGIADILRRRYAEYRNGVRPEPIAERLNCSRRQQAEILFDALEPLVHRRK